MDDPETPEEAPSVDPVEGRRARLLATFLLILFLVFGAVDVTGLLMVPGYSPPWQGYLFLAGAWLLNRSGRYTAAAAVTLTMFPAVILGVIASGGNPRDLGSLVYLVPGVLVASILHSARGTVLFAGASVATILLTPLLAPAASLRSVTTPLVLVTITAGLAVVSLLHHGRLEGDRQAELRESEARLRLALEAAQQIESQREELIRELEAKNAELERFTYTVSHDLKSPLVTVKGFLGLIAKDVAEGRTERLREDVARMTSAAESMQHLLHELLRLSRIGRIVNPPERVPFGEVAREAAALVRARLEERRVRVGGHGTTVCFTLPLPPSG